jgi:hypothetical protein
MLIVFHKYLDYEIATQTFGGLAMRKVFEDFAREEGHIGRWEKLLEVESKVK